MSKKTGIKIAVLAAGIIAAAVACLWLGFSLISSTASVSIKEWMPPSLDDIQIGMSMSQIKRMHPEFEDDIGVYFLRMPGSEYDYCRLFFRNGTFRRTLEGVCLVSFGSRLDKVCPIIKEWIEKLGKHEKVFVQNFKGKKCFGMGWQRDNVQIILLFDLRKTPDDEHSREYRVSIYVLPQKARVGEIIVPAVTETKDGEGLKQELDCCLREQ